jgi:hypothetical protein
VSPRVVHIVPRLPPPPEGVGSFALTLAEALSAREGIDSRFLVASPSWEGPADSGLPAARIPAPSPAALCEALAAATEGEGTVVLLHYANYGYQPRGCPAWLIGGLARWQGRGQGRLVTVFHEVHAMGPPWRSSFWLSPLQRRLAASLARRSDGLATSMGLYRRILLAWVPGREIAVLPVFSTVGEPAAPPPLEGRARRLVVFGGPGSREQAYRDLGPAMAAACRALGIEEVLDIGPDAGPGAPDLPVPVRRLGVLPDSEVSALLAGSLAGFVAYPAPFLPKSTIFAAYCAHRMLPVAAWPRPRREAEPLPPFWTPRSGEREEGDRLQGVADEAHSWYRGHSVGRHAAAYRSLLFP